MLEAKDKHNIIFYYSSRIGMNTGRGGAYYSMLAHRKQLMSVYNTFLLHQNSLSHSTILDGMEDLVYGKGSIFNSVFKVYSFFSSIRPKVFFSYSNRTFTIYIRFLCKLFRCKYIYVKAGGPNYLMKQYFSNVIFFMKENLDYCKGMGYKNAFLISNRVDPVDVNYERLDQFDFSDYRDCIKILRVSRINKVYKEVFEATINQHIALQDKGIRVLTHLVGYPEDSEVTAFLADKIKDTKDIYLLTEDRYTVNAVELIPLYDIIVGIGRGFWEAVSLNKFVLGYSNNCNYPILVNATNISTFKEYNFSTRVRVDAPEAFVDYLSVYYDRNLNNSYCNEMAKEFDENYSTKNLQRKLLISIAESNNERYKYLIKTLEMAISSVLKSNYHKIRGKIKRKLQL
jgi:hypothetical protein